MLRDAIRDLELQVLGAHSLLERDGGAALVVTLHGTLAREECHQFMFADFQIAEIDFLDAAFQQRLGFAGVLGDVAGVAGFHSGLGTARPQDAGNIKAKVLVCIGADDPMIGAEPREAFVQEMRAGGVDWQMELYGGVVHSFTNPEADKRGNPALKYDAKADARSWLKLRGFLDEIFA